MKKQPFKKSSRLAFRSALFSALLVGLLAALLDFFFFNSTLQNSLLVNVLLIVGSFGIIYGIIYKLQFSRLEKLNQINRNIARKRFQDYDNIQSDGRDELDFLIKQSIRASKTVEREIQRLNRIENYRKEFIGDISHELKTPIFAIQGFIETLLNGAIDDDGVNRKFLKKAMRNVNRLIYLTKDLMEISKLETGELKSDVQDIYLRNVIKEVVENLQYKAKKEDVSLQFEDFSKSVLVNADRNQIKQVLINLIENAIKYNEPGGSVTVGAKSFSKDEDRMLVYVEDTGIGINQQFIDRVTERFFRVDKSRSREKGGTGLGLAIVKHIMEAHGEEFFIESTPDIGSTFSFTLSKVDRTSAAAEVED
ncbi:two-component system, OmpR family, phosphate regulon sensor histidine kinase PhoR [Fodinibius salinus]|uniref:histidine kinase n=1 Tax=Fodinibius salinus TaxID=860790 RepID=A0A5D3YIT9_9BACT|nr:ATP-binding protein [Fodinibius salinus]TYP93754.1 two-component system, OmpR family, phosphate regulon sensor histidine kinase PhoR [Fodinibius salinus]